MVEEADGNIIGYLTMEDVLEVLVGDIQDEHRKAERGILAYQPGKLLVRGDTPLFKVERLLGIDLDHIEAETLAGLVYETLKRVPEEEEVLEVEGLRIIIKKMKGPKIVTGQGRGGAWGGLDARQFDPRQLPNAKLGNAPTGWLN